jgi:long-subunit fatty acid transport protein
VPLAPSFGLSTDRWRPWYVGIGAYGNLGLTTDFPPDPASGITNRIRNQLAVIRFAPTVAYHFSDLLSVGASVLPALGLQESEMPLPGGARLELTADGLGIAAQAGALVGPWHGLSFALSYRTRGRLALRGDAKVGASRDHVDITYELPQSILASVAYEPGPKTTLGVQLRWTDWLSGPACSTSREL